MNLKFSNRTSKEANSILHFVENHLGQHESDEDSLTLEYDLGISGFNMDGESLFFPYNNNLNISRKFYCFEFDHTIEQEDVEDVELTIFNNDASTLQQAEGLFVNPAPTYNESDIYNQHDVVFHSDNKKYYYSYTEEPHDYNPYDAINKASINAQAWTREFYWSPSLDFSIKHVPQIQEVTYPSSPYSQYFPKHKQHINLMEMDLEFSNRSEKEAYAILHFLESHLGYKSFIFTPPAPYNRKRRFYCENWDHTYVFKNTHKITATFKQFPAGQTAPLTDDEMDQLVPELEVLNGKISGTSSVNFDITQAADSLGSSYVKTIVLTNVGETPVEITGVTSASPFTKSNVGLYKDQYSVGNKSYSLSVTNDLNIESNRVVKLSDNSEVIFYAEDGFKTTINSADEATTGKLTAHPNDFIDENLTINPGEKRYLEVYFDSAGKISAPNPAYFGQSELKIEYKDADDNQSEFNVSVSAVINSKLLNENKYSKTVTIYSQDAPTSDPVVFDATNNTDNIIQVYSKNKNEFLDLVASCAQESESLAVFNNAIEAQTATQFNTSDTGFFITGIIRKKGAPEYRDYRNQSEISWLTGNGSLHNIDSDSGYNATDVDGVLCLKYGDSGNLKFRVFNQADCLVKTNGHIRESRGSGAFNNLNIANFIKSRFISSQESLENITKLNVNLVGDFTSSSSGAPAIELGHGYNSKCDITINVGLNRYYRVAPDNVNYNSGELGSEEYLDVTGYQERLDNPDIQTWNPAAYSKGVLRKLNGVIYMSKKDNNTTNPEADSISWSPAYEEFLQTATIVGHGG